MTFDQALVALQQGLKVRLPEWMGYWKAIENAEGDQTILAFRGNGEIETRIDGKHLFRTDWEILAW